MLYIRYFDCKGEQEKLDSGGSLCLVFKKLIKRDSPLYKLPD